MLQRSYFLSGTYGIYQIPFEATQSARGALSFALPLTFVTKRLR